jgi:hypothetical protein
MPDSTLGKGLEVPRMTDFHPSAVQPWRARDLVLPLLILVGTCLFLLAIGRVPVCTCGQISLWHGGIQDSQTSQQLTDPYSFTHVTHGFLFYGAIWCVSRLLNRPIRPGVGLSIATFAEGAWEILENIPASIERFRAATINLHYYGDSVLNSAGDILAMMLGFWLAARLPAWVVVAAALASEVVLGLLVRDNLLLQMLMFAFPIEAIKAWQLGS